MNYQRKEVYDQEKVDKLTQHYKAIMEILGEDVKREGLVKTPERAAKAG